MEIKESLLSHKFRNRDEIHDDIKCNKELLKLLKIQKETSNTRKLYSRERDNERKLKKLLKDATREINYILASHFNKL
jgi:hypothetical protein